MATRTNHSTGITIDVSTKVPSTINGLPICRTILHKHRETSYTYQRKNRAGPIRFSDRFKILVVSHRRRTQGKPPFSYCGDRPGLLVFSSHQTRTASCDVWP
ncbi:hypothetical protein KM043_013554 [Ampulex compressa]|nr:hypothetical protein KM043_013554 [Ampulex compressa]